MRLLAKAFVTEWSTDMSRHGTAQVLKVKLRAMRRADDHPFFSECLLVIPMEGLVASRTIVDKALQDCKVIKLTLEVTEEDWL